MIKRPREGVPSEDLILGRETGLRRLSIPDTSRLFVNLGSCPDPGMRTALANYIDTLNRDDFIAFAQKVSYCVSNHTVKLSDGSIRKAPTSTDYSPIRFKTRSHENMTAKSFQEKVRGCRKCRTGNEVGTPFQEQQDDGKWLKVVTHEPRFERCIRFELVRFLRDNAFHDTASTRPFREKFRAFYSQGLFEKFLSLADLGRPLRYDTPRQYSILGTDNPQLVLSAQE